MRGEDALRQIEQRSAADFVDVVSVMLKRDGCAHVNVFKKDGNHGLDVLATTPNGRPIAVGCFRHTGETTVHRSMVRRLHEHVLRRDRTNPAALMIVTSGRLTSNAHDYADAHRIDVVGRHALSRWLLGYPPLRGLRPLTLAPDEIRDQSLLTTRDGPRMAWLVVPVVPISLITAGFLATWLMVAVGLSTATLSSGLDAHFHPYQPARRWAWWPLWAEASARLAVVAAATWFLLCVVFWITH
ncbi:restriction endonuclease [Frankia sp. AiPa1]|uniref:restriction endonuclease n=1 Tax=Frankia sp. AiPa1 TaxID=573492 RepID=UPI00202B43CB|nr:restriction endonuclease [Frankia sp. AiPa1]MCL9759375.1 restriction endonuclease [Frankia sp. AiPa1]